MLCTFLYTGEQLSANPMQLVGRPKLARPLPKDLPRTSVEALLDAVAKGRESKRQTDWAERDLAIILTALLAGVRADELRQANIRYIRKTDGPAAVIHVKGKGGKERGVPIEAELLAVVDAYLDTRTRRFAGSTKRKTTAPGPMSHMSLPNSSHCHHARVQPEVPADGCRCRHFPGGRV